MDKVGLKFTNDYIEFLYSYLKNINGLDSNYSKLRLSYLLKNDLDFLKETLSFKEYKAVEMEDFIIEELRDRLELINASKEELETVEFEIELNKDDLDYFYDSIKKAYAEYIPFIFDIHVVKALLSNEKAFLTLKCRTLKEDSYFQADLMANIQYQLVGRISPPPCANGRIKRDYYNLFKNLEKRVL